MCLIYVVCAFGEMYNLYHRVDGLYINEIWLFE